MYDVQIGLRQGIGLEALQHMHARRLAIDTQETRDLITPIAHQVGRHHQQRGKGPQMSQAGQRLHRLAQAHLIGQQAAAHPAEPVEARLLEGPQLTQKAALWRLQVIRQKHQAMLFQRVVARFFQCLIPAIHVGGRHRQRVALHQPVDIADDAPVRAKAGDAAPAAVGARKEPLGHLGDCRFALDLPGAAALVIAQRAVDMRAARRRAQVGRVKGLGLWIRLWFGRCHRLRCGLA